MNARLGLAILILSIVTSVVIIGLAYVTNYDSMLAKPEGRMILLLLSINVIANNLQIILAIVDLLGDHFANIRKRPEKDLEEKFYKATKDLKIPYSPPS